MTAGTKKKTIKEAKRHGVITVFKEGNSGMGIPT